MSGAPTNLHLAWARVLLRGLATSGVVDVVVSPGSRSTPLVIAIADDPGIRAHVVLDERSAAFFALGQARATGRPSVLVCTSGTAAAHYLPAVVEADAAGIPIVVITADRPWEAHDCGASQTIDQSRLFGGFVRYAADVGQPDPTPEALRAIARVAAQAVAAATGARPGPVHVNVRFRKPLEPVDAPDSEPWSADVEAIVARGSPRVVAGRIEPDPGFVAELAARVAATSRGLLVCGPSPAREDGLRAAVGELSRKAAFPVLAEATSQVRFGPASPGAVVCSSFDALLRAPAVRARLAPDLVIELGAPATSSAWAGALAELRDVPRWVVAPSGFPDPDGSARGVVQVDPAIFVRALASRLADRVRPSPYAMEWARLDAVASPLVDRTTEGDALGEGRATRCLVESMPEGALLAVGNSLAVRHLDTYCRAGGRALPVLSQRGASGIDGLVSGAAGAAAASGRPVGLLVGDLSFAHDASGLAAARAVDVPLVIVVLQNGGGRIFDQLPIARRVPAGTLSRFFTTPADLDLAALARAYGVAFARARRPADLAAALAAGWGRAGTTLIEAVVGDAEAARVEALRAAIAAAATEAIGGEW